MAEKQGGAENVDQNKVKADAEKLAGNANQGTANAGPNTGAATTSQQPATQQATQQPATGSGDPAQNTGANFAKGGVLSNEPINQGGTINQGNPGALKPGQQETAKTGIAPQLSEEDAEAELLRQYGEGYVKAVKPLKKGEEGEPQRQTFSRRSWELLGDNKEGWKPEVKEPAEVKALKNVKKPNS